MKKLLYLLPVMLILLTGCKTKENLGYFHNNTPVAEQVVTRANWQLKIEPGDELSVYINTELPELTATFNLPDRETDTKSYFVDKQGYINLPKVGKVKAEGLTTTQLAEEVTRRVAEFAEAPTVRVELLNFKVSVLGEVQKPAVIKVPTERMTVLEALSEAGDLTVFGRRDNVTLIREEGGEVTYHRLDLSDGDLIKSPYYYLQQNDVIYVEPNDARRDQAEYSVNNSYKIQVVSAIISGASVIASLVIALAVK
ncbi:MAG: polysaccharide export protein [Muribaculaceae bacterium]|nr:polysaccharide export protein [Bacteroidales bacterium]MDE6243412.1 polysaccharide export protein [Muribaculaceae bacterium]